MQIQNKIIVTKENQNDFQELTQCGDIEITSGVSVSFPALQTSGYIYLYENVSAKFPVLQTSGYICLYENVSAKFPVLQTSGNIYFKKNIKASFPVLQTSGDICLCKNAKFIHKLLNGLKYKSVDNSLFVIESEKKLNDIIILKGYNIEKIENNELKKEYCFVAQKDNYYAHGTTIKKAIEDLEFKIISEKLKKEPIKADTQFTVRYYRLLTGACDLGCRSWMETNNIPFKIEGKDTVEKNPIAAKELLPILERTNAYGLDKIKSLIQF